jgi:hypothetical protein
VAFGSGPPLPRTRRWLCSMVLSLNGIDEGDEGQSAHGDYDDGAHHGDILLAIC